MSSATIISAKGIGDALLMMIAAKRLTDSGYNVALFHEKSALLQPLFDIEIRDKIDPSDLYLCQNDNSERAWSYLENRPKNFHFLFPKPCTLLQEGDFQLEPSMPMATSIALSMQRLLDCPFNKNNGLKIPSDRIYRHNPRRVIIHPTSADARKNWSKEQFLLLSNNLKDLGFDPLITVSQNEAPEWSKVNNLYISESLLDLRNILYESGYFIGNDSGVGHLASNLKIPTLTISGNPKAIQQWRPDWHTGIITTPKVSLPNFKGIGLALRDQYWQSLISVKRVLADFNQLVHSSI